MLPEQVKVPVPDDRINAAERLAEALDRDQVLWLSGYLAGLASRDADRQKATAPAAAFPATILFGTQTGNSRRIAESLLARLDRMPGARSISMADYRFADLTREKQLIVVVSTHGEGDPPDAAEPFFRRLLSTRAPELGALRYAVLALGDSSYEHYCKAGQDLDRRLEQLGAERIRPLVECDIDFQDAAGEWMEALVSALDFESEETNVVAITPRRAENRTAPERPVSARVLETQSVTGRGTKSPTFHLELELADDTLAYQPGDALGVWPENPPQIIAGVLDAAGLAPDDPVVIDGESKALEAALARDRELTQLTLGDLKRYAESTGQPALEEFLAGLTPGERAEVLRTWQWEDVLRRFPSTTDAQRLVDGMAPLRPRLYSIASSPEAAPGEVHLTIARVAYELAGQNRHGAASNHLESLPPGETVRVYLEPNPAFRLPADGGPLIMIGAGTGIAPYRAFVEHWIALGLKPESWLIFGHRHFRTDFLYQAEWLNHLKAGRLTRMDAAFSRDAGGPRYVQDVVNAQASELARWVERGAHVYVCGSIAMGKGVEEALAQALGGLDALKDAGRLHRDVY
ncbi:MAG: flavodoxin domain-containing protein [Xanthomonadales bacterium]|nr:flavodoxin domain-containing protein [Xanthomonadales bacterium]